MNLLTRIFGKKEKIDPKKEFVEKLNNTVYLIIHLIEDEITIKYDSGKDRNENFVEASKGFGKIISSLNDDSNYVAISNTVFNKRDFSFAVIEWANT